LATGTPYRYIYAKAATDAGSFTVGWGQRSNPADIRDAEFVIEGTLSSGWYIKFCKGGGYVGCELDTTPAYPNGRPAIKKVSIVPSTSGTGTSVGNKIRMTRGMDANIFDAAGGYSVVPGNSITLFILAGTVMGTMLPWVLL
jgi:hypothetical protein